jgi:hypothetical protein
MKYYLLFLRKIFQNMVAHKIKLLLLVYNTFQSNVFAQIILELKCLRSIAWCLVTIEFWSFFFFFFFCFVYFTAMHLEFCEQKHISDLFQIISVLGSILHGALFLCGNVIIFDLFAFVLLIANISIIHTL